MAHMSPATKTRVREVNGLRKCSERSRRMVGAYLMKHKEIPVRETASKGIAGPASSKENGCIRYSPSRPLKRTRQEDHAARDPGSPNGPARPSLSLTNDFFDAEAPSVAGETIEVLGDGSAGDIMSEIPSLASPSGNILRRLQIRVASAIARPQAADELLLPSCREQPIGRTKISKVTGSELQSPFRGPREDRSTIPPMKNPEQSSPRRHPANGCSEAVEPNVEQPMFTAARCGNDREGRKVDDDDKLLSCYRDSHSPQRVQLEQGCTAPNGFESLLGKVGCHAGSQNVSCSLGLPAAELNGDADSEPSKVDAQVLQTRVTSPNYFDPPSNFHGLWNLGNTCYLNSVVQLLCNLPCFIVDVREAIQAQAEQKFSVAKDGIFNALVQVFRAIHRSEERAVVDASSLRGACKKHMTDFFANVQQDAQEYLFTVLDKIQEEFTSLVEPMSEESRQVSSLRGSMCPTTKNFSCRVRNIFSCEGCGNVVNVDQSSRHFSLPLPEEIRGPQAKVPDIDTLLNIYFQAETLSRKCENCGAETMRSETKIVQLPRVVVLHINRFEIDRHMLCSKVSVPVKFTDVLDLEKWCVEDNAQVPIPSPTANGNRQDSHQYNQAKGDCPPFTEKAYFHEKCQTNGDGPTCPEKVNEQMARNDPHGCVPAVSTKYRLQGVVSHVGRFASCGHYMVDIFDSASNTYVRCDDHSVRGVSPMHVFSEEKSAEAYMLCYVRGSSRD